jgi:hypothetical protein
LRVEVRALWHSPVYEGILRAVHEWEADLLIVGAHEPRPVPHTVLLDTDWQLIRLCPCPLLLVKAKAGEPYSTVLAAVDPLHRHAEPDGLDNLSSPKSSSSGRSTFSSSALLNAGSCGRRPSAAPPSGSPPRPPATCCW